MDEDYLGDCKSDEEVFKSKMGNCVDVSQFNKYAMDKAGYMTSLLAVAEPGYPEGHVVLAIIESGEIYILDKNGPNHLFRGPYKSYREVPYDIKEINWYPTR